MEKKADSLTDLDENTTNKKLLFRFKLILIILSVIILGLIIGIIVLGIKKQEEKIVTKEIIIDKDDDPVQKIINYLLDKGGYVESWNELYGQKYIKYFIC